METHMHLLLGKEKWRRGEELREEGRKRGKEEEKGNE